MSNVTSLSSGMILSVRSDVEPVDPSVVPLMVREIFVGQCFRVATVTVLIFDAVITLDKEAKYFWVDLLFQQFNFATLTGDFLQKIPRRPVDFVYFANRYIGIFGAVTFLFGGAYGVDLAICNFAIWSRDVANWTTVILIDYILTIRVLALYSRDQRLSMCLYTFLMMEAAFKLGLFIYIDISYHAAVDGLAKGVTVCGPDAFPPWQWGLVDWMIPQVYGVILMVLALYKAAEYWRMSAGFKGFVLVKILIEDQIIYFMLVISVAVFAIVEFKVEPSNIFAANILSSLGSPSFLSVLGSRMLFNLKEVGERGQNEGTSYRSPSGMISDMEFAEPVNPEESQSGGAEGEDHDSAHVNQA